jgi:hypothetical protein
MPKALSKRRGVLAWISMPAGRQPSRMADVHDVSAIGLTDAGE